MCFIYRMQGFFTFALNDHFALYDQVSAKAAFHLDGLVDKRDRLLALHSQAKFFKFIGKAGFVG